ncbi:photosystem II stability/assembly factor-like uncharacterized protein [Undibacterium sp. GrIS 1.8]|uniref:WD40/YVTN/BNR-like repeat-containing protein n=1 Tax=Undibacterium sp. GrIS 1.8 TaxID=3143934 RepID=UPI003397A523
MQITSAKIDASFKALLALTLLGFGSFCFATESAKAEIKFESGTVSGLGARNIGSAAMSGRIAAIAGVRNPSGKTTLFIGAASGGVWKTEDSGTLYRPVFDDQSVQSIGAITIDPSNPQNIWVGTGEAWTRNSVSIGNGIYKSSDGGDTWKNLGLPESERIAKIIVHPKDSNTVYACVVGKLWSDSAERGLYKTQDGGNTWSLILKGKNLSTGCSSVSLDPTNPDIVFSALWDFRRQGWTFRSGGESPSAASGSGMFRSINGGANWVEISESSNNGFAKKPYGRIAVAVAPSNAKRVYAFVESTDSALYVSDDAGQTWQQRDKSQMMVWRPFYFAQLIVDPLNADKVFKAGGSLIVSTDAGNSFTAIGGFVGMHGDVHDVWIDPSNTQTLFAGDDGGMWNSFNGGSKWWKAENLPVSQFYHVSVDNKNPYQVYGGLQDNSSWVGQSQYPGGITNARWENMFGGDGFWMFSDPTDSDYLYAESQGGYIGRVNRHTHENRDIQPKLNTADAKSFKKLRFNWNAPIALSPNDKKTLYIGSQFLFRTRDHGQSWTRISPDLTTNAPERQEQEKSGGVTVDNSAAEMHETIYSISESPKNANVIWVGTDDGNLQITRDAGKSWNNVAANVTGLPRGAWVSWVQASQFDAGTAYATFDRHTVGDMAAHVYRTRDYGKTWTPLVSPENLKGVLGYVHVIKEDLQSPNLLFLGTELGLYISIDGGERWARFKGGNLPNVAVRDLAIHPRDNDLVLATHGRGIWIVDDITPLRSLSKELLSKDIAFVGSRPTVQSLQANGGWVNGDAVFVGENSPDAAVITYYQRNRHLFGKLNIEVLDASGKVIDQLPASKRPGLNRVFWSMHEKPPRVPPAAQLAGFGTQGPRVLPGTYRIRIRKNGQTIETNLSVGLDARAKFTLVDRKAQWTTANRVKQLFGDENALMDRIIFLRKELAEGAASVANDADLKNQISLLDSKVDVVRKQIVATTEGGAITGEERLREHTDLLYGAILTSEGKPTDDQLANILALEADLKNVKVEFSLLLEKDLPVLNKALISHGKKALNAPPKNIAWNENDTSAGRPVTSALPAGFMMLR